MENLKINMKIKIIRKMITDFKLGSKQRFFFLFFFTINELIKIIKSFHVKPLNQIGLALTITNYMEISGKNKKEEIRANKT